VNVKIPAGFPSPALDYMEKRTTLDELYVKDPLSTFIVDAEGDSMINAFIPPKARLVVDRSLTPKNGDIVVAELNGEFTVKFLKKTAFKCLLIAANPKYDDIEVTGEQQLNVFGVVTAIMIDTKTIYGAMLNKL
jgi:DNA polymerase V